MINTKQIYEKTDILPIIHKLINFCTKLFERSLQFFISENISPVLHVSVNAHVCRSRCPRSISRLYNLHPWYWNTFFCSLISSGDNSAFVHMLQLQPIIKITNQVGYLLVLL